MNTNKIHLHFSYYSRKSKDVPSGRVSLTGVAEELSRELRANGKERTANVYVMVAGCLTRFAGNENLVLEDITSGLLCRYDTHMIGLGRKPNSVSFHMRNLRAIYNKAVCKGLIASPTENLFASVHTGIYQTRKRALTEEEMRALSETASALEIPAAEAPVAASFSAELNAVDAATIATSLAVDAIPATVATSLTRAAVPAAGKLHKLLSDVLYCALLYFLFCFHARGMAFIDLAFLKKSCICDGYIHYCRKKTGKFLSVKITTHMERILHHFSFMVADSPYLFPIVCPGKGNERKQYETALTLQNRRLKILGRLAGISKLLTTHVARHSWATIAKRNHVPLAVICDCLGHRDEKTTSIYLDSFEASVMDEASELVSNVIC
ncbi:MAG: site-specific integrase [Dysgonamonadaceae bacterium]|jgi:integrase|nr:site-specific integrase [Dysgonamonadaceae bacterium]